MAEYAGIRIQAFPVIHEFAAEFISKTLSQGELVLDIAAGNGALSQRLIDKGFIVHSTSWNDKVSLSNTCFNLNLDNNFDTEDFEGNRYPVICAIEIIEHLENPSSFLRCLNNIIKEDGHLILSTPNIECAAARLQWLFHGCPRFFEDNEVRNNRHISMMWRQGIEYMIDLAGFDIIDKQFLGEARMESNLTAYIKRSLYKLMESTLPGETHGAVRLYVLKPRKLQNAKSLGPDDVY